MATDTYPAGFGKCDSETERAVRVRRLGTLPAALAFGCCDIGEAVIKWEDGRTSRSLITWGRNISPDDQHWYSRKTVFTPVWCGDSDGNAELILCTSTGDDKLWAWIRAGLEMTAGDIPWKEVGDA